MAKGLDDASAQRINDLSVDEGETWYGMDVTYHPPTDDREGASRWHTLWFRVQRIREGFTSFGPAFKRDIKGKLKPLKKGRR